MSVPLAKTSMTPELADEAPGGVVLQDEEGPLGRREELEEGVEHLGRHGVEKPVEIDAQGRHELRMPRSDDLPPSGRESLATAAGHVASAI